MALLEAWPEGAQAKDNDGVIPLFRALRMKASEANPPKTSEAIITALLRAWPESVQARANGGNGVEDYMTMSGIPGTMKARLESAQAAVAEEKAVAERAMRGEQLRRASLLGLLEPLRDVGVDSPETVAKVVAWCDANGASSLAEVQECGMVDDLVTALGLKPIPAKKLQATLQPTANMAAQLSRRGAPTEVPAEGGDIWAAAGEWFARSFSSLHIPESKPAPQSKQHQLQQVRFADVQDEPLAILGPITGVMKAPRLSLHEAAAATGVEGVEVYAFLAAEQSAQIVAKLSLDLDGDEVGSIYLYTMESELYPTLNRLLRQRERQALKPFFPYLQLMLSARQKLPRYVGVVWRGVRGVDLREKYPTDTELYWWAFSSTTKQLETLTNPQFLGKDGVRTVFMIEVQTGVDIERFSALQGQASEAEVLLYPGTKLQVIGSMEMGQGLFQVHLREVEVPMQLVQ